MKIVVGIKHVPDTETKVKIVDGAFDESAVTKWVMSTYDEYALEQAIQFRDAAGEGEVIVVCAGRSAAQTSLRQALAMGADRAVLVEDERLDGADGLGRSRVLAAAIRAEAPDLVLMGKYGVGPDEGLTGPMVAELLDWAHASAVSKLEVSDGKFTAQRAVEGAVENLEGALPAVITCDKGLNEPRYPSLKGIMQAKKKPLETRSLGDLGVADADIGPALLTWESMEMPPARAAGRLLDGTPQEAARELARLLHEEEKVI